jgi:hypothetical protein
VRTEGEDAVSHAAVVARSLVLVAHRSSGPVSGPRKLGGSASMASLSPPLHTQPASVSLLFSIFLFLSAVCAGGCSRKKYSTAPSPYRSSFLSEVAPSLFNHFQRPLSKESTCSLAARMQMNTPDPHQHRAINRLKKYITCFKGI